MFVDLPKKMASLDTGENFEFLFNLSIKPVTVKLSNLFFLTKNVAFLRDSNLAKKLNA